MEKDWIFQYLAGRLLYLTHGSEPAAGWATAPPTIAEATAPIGAELHRRFRFRKWSVSEDSSANLALRLSSIPLGGAMPLDTAVAKSEAETTSRKPMLKD